jgi:ATP-dependent Clp protease ATP-binding subunit ClpB
MPPFNHFTTKAKEAIRRAHELAIERGQNHVNPVHLLASLVLQEESMVNSILEKLEVDMVLLTDSILEGIEGGETSATLSPSYQIYLTPELAQTLENSSKVAASLKDEFVSTEHLFIAMLDIPGSARELLSRFRIDKADVLRVLEELKNTRTTDTVQPKRLKSILITPEI